MDGPLVGACGAQTVVGQVDAFADTHAGVAEQEEDISAEIVAAHELLLEELILLGGERSWQSVGRAGNIPAQQQVGQFREMVGASQLMEDGAQSEEPADAGGRGQRRILGAQVRHPSKDMRIAAQLFETGNCRVLRAEIDEEAAHHDDEALTGPYVLDRMLYWDLVLNFHRESTTVVTVESTMQHPEDKYGDHERLPQFKVDAGGNSKCQVSIALPLSFNKYQDATTLGDYSLHVHIAGIGVEPLSKTYDFRVTP
jgi:hypothetical protein